MRARRSRLASLFLQFSIKPLIIVIEKCLPLKVRENHFFILFLLFRVNYAFLAYEVKYALVAYLKIIRVSKRFPQLKGKETADRTGNGESANLLLTLPTMSSSSRMKTFFSLR